MYDVNFYTGDFYTCSGNNVLFDNHIGYRYMYIIFCKSEANGTNKVNIQCNWCITRMTCFACKTGV